MFSLINGLYADFLQLPMVRQDFLMKISNRPLTTLLLKIHWKGKLMNCKRKSMGGKKKVKRGEEDKELLIWYQGEKASKKEFLKLWYEEQEKTRKLRERLQEAHRVQKKVGRGGVGKVQVARVKRNRKAKTAAIKAVRSWQYTTYLNKTYVMKNVYFVVFKIVFLYNIIIIIIYIFLLGV